MTKLFDILFNWAQAPGRWPLLLLFAIPTLFEFLRQYLSYSFRDVVHYWAFLIVSGCLIVVSGLLYFAIGPEKCARRKLWTTIPLLLIGVLSLSAGVRELIPTALPMDTLVVAVTHFVAVNPAAIDEAGTFPHRIAQQLEAKSHAGVPIEVKVLTQEVVGTTESQRQHAALDLGHSSAGAAHVVLWGDVRKEDRELFVQPRLTIVQPLGTGEIDSRPLGPFVGEEPTFLEFKRHVASEVTNLVALLYGLSYYKAKKWDQASQLLNDIQTAEAHLYKGLSLKNKVLEQYQNTLQINLDILDESERDLGTSVVYFLDKQNSALAALSTRGLADVSVMRNNLSVAVEHYEVALAIAERANSEKDEALALIGACRAKSGMRHYDEAKQDVMRAITVAERLEDKAILVDALNCMAQALVALGENEQSCGRLDEAVAIASKLGDNERLVYLYLYRANVRRKEWQSCLAGHINDSTCLMAYNKANDDYKQSLRLAQKQKYTAVTAPISEMIDALAKERGGETSPVFTPSIISSLHARRSAANTNKITMSGI